MERANDIVVTSRIRLARNLKNYRFRTKQTIDEAERIINDIGCAVASGNTGGYYRLWHIKDIGDIEKNVLIEKHIISPALAENKDGGAFLLSSDSQVSIMVNEEDHLRIQVIGDGMCLNECWQIADSTDDMLEQRLDYAFDRELGYITSCPTNIGTGMRASVMLHLPALSMTNQTDRLLYAVSQLGVAVRGVYGEGTKSMGNLYQLSNQGTLGVPEDKLIEKIKQIAMQIIDKERLTRQQLMESNFSELEDEVYRAYGLLTNARSMTTDEAMKLLSVVKLGGEMDIIREANDRDLCNLMTTIQPYNLQANSGREMSSRERDRKRAEVIRNELTSQIRTE